MTKQSNKKSEPIRPIKNNNKEEKIMTEKPTKQLGFIAKLNALCPNPQDWEIIETPIEHLYVQYMPKSAKYEGGWKAFFGNKYNAKGRIYLNNAYVEILSTNMTKIAQLVKELEK